jgi:hypothetical protein
MERIDEIVRLVIHELRPLGLGRQSDRRGPICDLALADIPNTEHAIGVATRMIQRVCSLLDGSHFWSANRDKGPSGSTDRFEAWIDICPEGKAVRICHKYWGEEKVGVFAAIMLHLADLHGWAVDDRRVAKPAGDVEEPQDREEEEFLEVVGRLNPAMEPDVVAELAETYANSAFHMNTSPWRLLALDAAGICYCDPDLGQGEASVREPLRSTKGAGATVIPFHRRGDRA